MYDTGYEDNDGRLCITDEVIQEALYGILTGEWDTDNSALQCASVRTFEDAGVMTRNKGLVISLPDGTNYQLTIVESR